MPEQPGSGTGHLRSGQRDLGLAHYEIHVGIPNKPGTVVELESPPVAQNGEILELVLEDGRVLQLQVSGVSPYCRVIGGRLTRERRDERDTACPRTWTMARRRSEPQLPGDSSSLPALHGERGARHTPRRHDDHTVLHGVPSWMGRASRRCRGRDADGPPRDWRGPNRPNAAAPIACRRRPASYCCDRRICAQHSPHVRRGVLRLRRMRSDVGSSAPAIGTRIIARSSRGNILFVSDNPLSGAMGGSVRRRAAVGSHGARAFSRRLRCGHRGTAQRNRRHRGEHRSADLRQHDRRHGARGPHARSGRAHVRRGARERHQSRLSGARARVAAEAGRGRRRDAVQPGTVQAN